MESKITKSIFHYNINCLSKNMEQFISVTVPLATHLLTKWFILENIYYNLEDWLAKKVMYQYNCIKEIETEETSDPTKATGSPSDLK